MRSLVRCEIEDRIRDRPHLELVETNVFRIPERLREYDPSFFLVWNRLRGFYEVHSLDNTFNTYAMTTAHKPPDCRTMKDVAINDIRVRGAQVFKEIDESQAAFERRKAKERSNFNREFALDARRAFADDAWGGGKSQFRSAGGDEK